MSEFEEMRKNGDLPEVSVLVPIRNEEDHIAKCLDSILENDYPHDKVEILVIDGRSDDRSREIVKEYEEMDTPEVRLLDNPERIVPTAMNIGLENATGEVIIRVDGHSFVDEDFISTSVGTLLDHDEVDVVGGPVRPALRESSTYIQKAISIALSSPLASGSPRFSGKSGYVTTVSFGAYWARVFDEIGGFDERFVRTQDYELNYRLVNSGGKIYMNPEITSYYYPRRSFVSLWKQYFQFGFWKTKVMKKCGKLLSLGNNIPPAFILGLMASGLMAGFIPLGLLALLSLVGSYLLILSFFGLRLVSREEEKLGYIFGVILALITIHLSFGFGFLKGLFFGINGKLTLPWKGL
ncbi:glycosyltransferase family 2 protein [Candidatus Bipolaricaulota bacterium]|nr:glycosyltransferase family 2 protein [Candidatus Bipolaricaulota bacterium]